MITEYLKNLTDARNKAWEEAKPLLEAANKRDDKQMTAEERAKFDAINASLDSYDEQIRDLTDRDRKETEAAAARAEYEKIVRPDILDRRDAENDDRLRAFLRGEQRAFDVDLSAVAREKQLIRAGVTGRDFRNDLVEGTTTAGGYTVPTSFVRRLYDFLEVFSGMRRTNATILTTASGENLDVPKVTAHGTAAIVGEGTALAEADPAFGKVTLGAWKYGQLLQISYELNQDSGVDIEGFIAKDCGRALGRVTDTDYVLGNGTNKPLGLFAACGTGVTGQGGSTGLPSYANLVDLVYSVNEEYRMNGAQWVMRDATVGKIRGMTDTTGQPIWQPSTIAGTPDRLLGYPVVSDPNVAAMGTTANCIGFGDASPYYIRDVGAIRFERSDDYAFANDLVTYRSVLRTDGDLIDLTGAFKVYRGGTN